MSVRLNKNQFAIISITPGDPILNRAPSACGASAAPAAINPVDPAPTALFVSSIAHSHGVAIYGQLDPNKHDIWLPFDRVMRPIIYLYGALIVFAG
jgi:hypothetical protein